MREILAYEGPCFTVEWYYDENGTSQAFDYFNRLGDAQKLPENEKQRAIFSMQSYNTRVQKGEYYEEG
ncbi:hypothetical protein [Fibrobacter sp. UWB12]|uniref:hypothetical protein n=1 Tax=Fibrobacter sp. UWB12 TaxID=1896203 RepID=UPI00091885E7|nr:hypothetical protein [Fibrobacter sp. UWB12]SHK54489.1 hypothetical protein SAMN05720759_103360 [Fibrobacter sp. UWB12]